MENEAEVPFRPRQCPVQMICPFGQVVNNSVSQAIELFPDDRRPVPGQAVPPWDMRNVVMQCNAPFVRTGDLVQIPSCAGGNTVATCQNCQTAALGKTIPRVTANPKNVLTDFAGWILLVA